MIKVVCVSFFRLASSVKSRMIKNKKISSTLNDNIFAVETQCDNFFTHVMNF